MALDPFPADVIAAARATHAEFYPRGPLASITLAQWAVESAYGKDASGAFNFFGIKATKAQIAAGQAKLKMTREVIGGKSIEEPQIIVSNAGYRAESTTAPDPVVPFDKSEAAGCVELGTPEVLIWLIHWLPTAA